MPDVVRIRVRGHSMLPALADGDELEVELGAPAAAGDVVLFMEGTLPVLHRVLSIRDGRVLTQGDGAPRPDPPFAATRILGVARVTSLPALAMRRRLLERMRATIRPLFTRRSIARLRVLRSLTIVFVLASSSAWLAVAAATADEDPLAPPPAATEIELVQQEIEKVSDLVRSLPEGDVKARRMLQLADLYGGRSRMLMESAKPERESRDRLIAEQARNGAPHVTLANLPAEKLAENDLKKAIAIYEHTLKKYPGHVRQERTLEQLLHLYLGIDELDKALAVLPRLGRASQPLARSHVAIGDFYVQNKKPVDALSHYEKAALIADPALAAEATRRAEECRPATTHSPAGPQP